MLKGVSVLYWCAFAAAFFTVAQFSFWGNYLPRVYPVHLRGTGESFAANIGGRMIGTSFAAVTAGLAAMFTPKGTPVPEAAKIMAYCAAGVGCFVYVVGFICSFFLPEPGHEDIDAEHHRGTGAPGTTAAGTVGQPTQVTAHGPQP
jgi:uncharacterized membrane protein YbhN (UPF0104 family)